MRTVDRAGHEWLDGVIFDITERRAAEEALRARDAEAARVAELEASRAGSSPPPTTPAAGSRAISTTARSSACSARCCG